MKIKEYPEVINVENEDYLLISNSQGTRKINMENLSSSLVTVEGGGD